MKASTAAPLSLPAFSPCRTQHCRNLTIQSVIRSVAPDLWSVRSLVTTVANVALLSDSLFPSFLSVSSETSPNPDPEFALRQAESLRGKAGRETALIRLLDRAGQGFSARFRFDEAAMVLRESLELRRSLRLPPFEIARAEIALAASLIEPGHHAAGMPYLEAALHLLNEQDINYDPAALDSLDEVATLLEKVDRVEEAKDLRERLVLSAQDRFGPEDPRTLTYTGNFGSTLHKLGDLGRARSIEEHVLELSKRLLGPEHRSTLTAMNNLGSTLWLQNDLVGAQSIAENVLDARRRILGPGHVETLIAMNNLATILASSGDLAGALALEEQVLAGLSQTFGPEDPRALITRWNIGIHLGRKGDLVGAREQLERVLEARRRLFGPAHRDTLAAIRELAGIYAALGQTVEANALLEEARHADQTPSQPKSADLHLAGNSDIQ